MEDIEHYPKPNILEKKGEEYYREKIKEYVEKIDVLKY